MADRLCLEGDRMVTGLEAEKRCSGCGLSKSLTEFYAEKRASDGKRSHCKLCVCNETSAYKKDNRDLCRKTDNIWRQLHPDRVMAHKKNYAANCRESRLIAQRRWRADNPEKAWAQNRVNKALLRGKIVKPNACENCGATTRLEGHHEDYSQPISVRWLCRSCHYWATQNHQKEASGE